MTTPPRDAPRKRVPASKRKLFVVDGHSHLYQAFHALPPLSAPDGRPTQAVYGVLNTLFKIIHDKKPDYLAVALDSPGPTFRHERYKDYKAHRPPMPEDLRRQLPLLAEVLEAMEIPLYRMEGYEADDIMGTLARQGEAQGLRIFLVTGDKDLLQMISSKTALYDARSDEVTDAQALHEKWRLAPEQVVDFLALTGDASDNVPGVPGIGPKTAQQLLATFGSLDRLLADLPKVERDTLREKLKTHQDQARLSRELVTIRRDCPVRLDLDRCRANGHIPPAAVELFRKLDFRRLLQSIDAPAASSSSPPLEVRIIDTSEKLRELVEQLNRVTLLSIDTETTDLAPHRAEWVGLSLCWEPDTAHYLPLRAPEGTPVLDAEEVRTTLGPVLGSPRVKKIGQNLKFDLQILRGQGIELEGIHFDAMLASYCIDPTRRRHGLDALAVQYLDHRMTPIEELIGKGASATRMDRVPMEKIAPYACDDASVPLRLMEILEKELTRQETGRLFREIEMPLLPVLADMEWTGIRVDPKVLARLSAKISKELERLEKRIHREAGAPFNINSPKQLSDILFGKLGFKPPKKTKSGASTDLQVLQSLAPHHPLPGLMIEYRTLAKLKSTYVDAIPKLVDPESRRLYTSFNQSVTATGRLSSSEPNLQNIPIRAELGREVRKAFLPLDRSGVLLSADYSQIELRVLAHLCEDPELAAAFRQDADIHTRVAAEIHQVTETAVTPEMRRLAKAINFSILYGKTPFTLARDLGIPQREAAAFIDAYFERYPGIARFIDRTIETARKEKEVRTLFGRRRPIPEIDSPNRGLRALGERTAVNTVVQGTAADLIKIAMIRIHSRMKREKSEARLLLQIHDELVFHVPRTELKKASGWVQEEMEGAARLDVPLKVNIASGRNWFELK
jgi:DNA polymerase-1